MLEEAVDFVRRSMRTKTIVDRDGHRADKDEYPIVAVREVILNALIHRDYSILTENTPSFQNRNLLSNAASSRSG